MVSPPWIPVPPPGYGGIEWVVHLLVEELVRRGHQVTLFATGDSATSATLRFVHERAMPHLMHAPQPDAMHVGSAYREIADHAGAGAPFDIVHDHTAWLGVAFAPLIPSPVVHTVHGAFHDENRAFYGLFRDHAAFVTVSEFQQHDFQVLPYVGAVHNAVDVASYPYRTKKDDYVLCLGRVHPAKGQAVAVRVAKAAGVPVVLAGKIDAGDAQAYFDAELLPLIDGETVRFLGEVTDASKRELLAGARALLFPIQWAEPFGIVMIEAMAAGTPVVAIRNGAVPEVVAHGETGFVCEDEKEMISALERVEVISPERCRLETERRFSPARMADAYIEIYERVIAAGRGK